MIADHGFLSSLSPKYCFTLSHFPILWYLSTNLECPFDLKGYPCSSKLLFTNTDGLITTTLLSVFCLSITKSLIIFSSIPVSANTLGITFPGTAMSTKADNTVLSLPPEKLIAKLSSPYLLIICLIFCSLSCNINSFVMFSKGTIVLRRQPLPFLI